MKRLLIATVLVVLNPVAAGAQTSTYCTKTEQGEFVAARDRAARLALTATTGISPNPVYERWFGNYNAKSAEHVRRNLKAIVKTLRTQSVTAHCRNLGEDLCDGETYAFVDKDRPYKINLCPNFFEMETMKQLTLETATDGNGTRAGTLVHEISHFAVVADTRDICYSRRDCSDMALFEPQESLINADSYQYFVEDVTFFGVSGEDESTDIESGVQ